MDFSRIASSMDIEKLQQATVAFFGVGGSIGCMCDLARCGVSHFLAVDRDVVDPSNIARQAHHCRHIGRRKVDACAPQIHAINPEAEVEGFPIDFTMLTDAEIDFHFGHADLFIFATDSFAAQAFGNAMALRLGKPAIWPGLYRGGQGGEVAFWDQDIPSCYRCLCAGRYQAHERAQAEGRSLDPPSDGADIFAIHLLDSIAGMLAIGLLTRGANNRYGRLIDALVNHPDGPRNFLQVKIDPTWSLRGQDVVREQLGIAEDNPAYFAWNTIVRSDPDGGEPPCPDCIRYRGRLPRDAEALLA